MEGYKYLELIKENLFEEAKNKGLSASSPITIDWGELQFILNQVQSFEQLLLMVRMIHQETKDEHLKFVIKDLVSRTVNNKLFDEVSKEDICHDCHNVTKVIRSEQYRIIDDEIKVKCLSCLVSQYSDTHKEMQQLMEYRLFVKEHKLEDKFEDFSQQRKNEFLY